MIISHIIKNDSYTSPWSIQTDKEHNKGVAEKASSFASVLGFGEWGTVMGLLHDKGKEQFAFQKYIQGNSGYKPEFAHSPRVPHAYVGALLAKVLFPQFYEALSFPIMGHHAGLYDYNKFEEVMKQQVPTDIKSIKDLGIQLTIPSVFRPFKQDIHHWIRLLYSCLVDADYLDTELFMNKENASIRLNKKSLDDLLPKLLYFLSQLKSNATNTPINQIRMDIQRCCLNASESEPGFYSLTVPTGGGKTISSIVWAINHAIRYGKKRIIIAIPYTSIIVQTAQILRDIFGPENVLEHHSNFNIDDATPKTLALKIKLATENWDYPIVVTTNVQLFESMFSNKPSHCRKLHNICNSVLILDEIQTLPLDYLQPIVDSLQTYQRLFGLSVLFTTASMPAIQGDYCNRQHIVFKGIPEIREIIPEKMNLGEKLKRVNLHFDVSDSTYDDIAARLCKYPRVLCIVNTRKDAKEIFTRLPKDGITLHLSRMMCPAHVRKTIMKIKKALQDDNCPVIRVISTQLIEAGVDIDFPIVFRQEIGLDSILQAAGRCNREGKLEKGDAFVFSLKNRTLRGYMAHANAARKNVTNVDDMYSDKAMHEYFIQLYSRTECFDKAQIEHFLYKPNELCFATAAQTFKLIDDQGINVIVNYDNSMELYEHLKTYGPNYEIMKQLGQYMVSLKEQDFKPLLRAGLIKEEITSIYFLSDRSQYKEDVGLVVENHWLEEILIN